MVNGDYTNLKGEFMNDLSAFTAIVVTLILTLTVVVVSTAILKSNKEINKMYLDRATTCDRIANQLRKRLGE